MRYVVKGDLCIAERLTPNASGALFCNIIL